MNLTLQDLIAIWSPILTLVGCLWYHFNNRIDKLENNLHKRINNTEEKLGEKIDSVRDRISRIEGQLVPTKIITFEETREKKPIEVKDQKTARR